MNLDQLASELNAVKGLMPETEIEYREDIFSISGFPHYETVLSNWFCYLLESNNKHGLTGLLADSLRDVIQQKSPDEQVDWLNDQVHCDQETITEKGNFIDLVVYDVNDSNDQRTREYENAIIIEHKVYAELYNDLTDYFESVVVNTVKFGIVLSARALNIKNEKYVNITYAELINAIRNNLGKYAINVELTYLGYLKDFLNNLDRMSEINESDALSFCFEHGGLITKVSEIKRKAEEELANGLRRALESSNVYRFQRKHPYSITIRAYDDRVSLIFGFNDLFSKSKMDWQYWLSGKGVVQWNKVPSHDRLHQEFDQKYEVREKKQGKDWVELLRGSFKLEDINSTEDFEDQFVNYLHSTMEPINNIVLDEIDKYNK